MSWGSARPQGFQSDTLAIASWPLVGMPLDTHAVGGWATCSTIKKQRIIPLIKEYGLDNQANSAVLTEAQGNPVIKFYDTNNGTGSNWFEVTVNVNPPAQTCPFNVTRTSGRFLAQGALVQAQITNIWRNKQG